MGLHADRTRGARVLSAGGDEPGQAHLPEPMDAARQRVDIERIPLLLHSSAGLVRLV